MQASHSRIQQLPPPKSYGYAQQPPKHQCLSRDSTSLLVRCVLRSGGHVIEHPFGKPSSGYDGAYSPAHHSRSLLQQQLQMHQREQQLQQQQPKSSAVDRQSSSGSGSGSGSLTAFSQQQQQMLMQASTAAGGSDFTGGYGQLQHRAALTPQQPPQSAGSGSGSGVRLLSSGFSQMQVSGAQQHQQQPAYGQPTRPLSGSLGAFAAQQQMQQQHQHQHHQHQFQQQSGKKFFS